MKKNKRKHLLLKYCCRKARKKIKFQYLLFGVITIAVAASTACCFLQIDPPTPPPPSPIMDAKVESGKEILESLANGAMLYSVQHGGNGKKCFPTKIQDVMDNVPPVIQKATSGYASSPIPIDGYLGRISAKSTADAFVFEAYPAQGFKGDILVITKDMKVVTIDIFEKNKQEETVHPIELPVVQKQDTPTPPPIPQNNKKKKSNIAERYNEIRNIIVQQTQEIRYNIDQKINPPPPPPPPIRKANPETAKELLQSLYTAAKYYSVQHGGNGVAKFPTSILEIRDAIPVAVKKAVVFKREEQEKAEPIDGYILIMYPSKSITPSDDFCFVAYPAKYFRGPEFEIDKTGNITEIKK